MSDWTLPLSSTLICGKSSSGKTTFAIRYLLNASVACRFVFDDLGQVAARLKARHAGTANECEAALQDRWVIFNPHVMFPEDTRAAFDWFCGWAFDASRRGPGKKILFVDELWQWQSPQGIPKKLAKCCNAGRAEGIELVTATQHPQLLNGMIRGTSTECVCFLLDEELPLDAISKQGHDPSLISRLPLGKFISRNRLSGSFLSGSVF